MRRWDRIVAAWAAGADQDLDDARVEQAVNLGSQWSQYGYVTTVGFCRLSRQNVRLGMHSHSSLEV
ncbi:hypothetical protein [Streptomyces sp. NPDC055056]